MEKRKPTTDLVAVNSLHVLLCLCNTVRAVVKRRDAHWNKTSDCLPSAGGGDDDDGLTQQQRRICRRTLDLMPAVVIAGQQTMQVCQTLFYDSRWNCSSVLRAPQFTADLTQGTIHPLSVHPIHRTSHKVPYTLFQFIPYTGPYTRYHKRLSPSFHTIYSSQPPTRRTVWEPVHAPKYRFRDSIRYPLPASSLRHLRTLDRR